ncbi:MAG: hypothetical protein Q7V19_13270, partial [Bacteroidales bacterium]|nr:hypothetical protein [Bacteroidales bacterium]
MTIFRLCFLLSVSVLFSNCNNFTYDSPQTAGNLIYGTWESVDSKSSLRIKFTTDTLVFYTLQEHGYIELIKFQYISYRRYDTTFVQTVEEVPLRLILIKGNFNKAVLCFYKNGKGIENHISNLLFIEQVLDVNGIEIQKFDSRNAEESSAKDIFILPHETVGLYAICYNQPDGLQGNIDIHGNRYFDLTGQSDFIVKLQPQPDFTKFLTKNIIFHYKKADGSTVPLTTYGIHDSVKSDTAQNQAFLVGYDRIARSEINDIVNNDIKGNVLFVKIGKDAFYSLKMLIDDSIR